MPAHSADGFGLEFTARTSWKARRYIKGKLIDVVPITWTKGFRTDKQSERSFLEVWYQNPDEMFAQKNSDVPFVVALAVAKDYTELPHRFDKFVGIFEVKATGVQISENSIDTEVLKRLSANSK